MIVKLLSHCKWFHAGEKRKTEHRMREKERRKKQSTENQQMNNISVQNEKLISNETSLKKYKREKWATNGLSYKNHWEKKWKKLPGGWWVIYMYIWVYGNKIAYTTHSQRIFSGIFGDIFGWIFVVVAFLSAQCCSRQRIIPVCRCHLKWTQRVYSSYRKCICIWKITKMYI